MDLAKKYRPKKIEDVVGQGGASNMVKEWIENNDIPHTIMFTGPSGTGKTTMARILADKLDCASKDIIEINIADSRGIDTAREIRTRATSKPMFGGKARVWILDEFHQATKDCQNALLKVLEEPKDWVYYIICTTEPGKLLRTITTRCNEVKCKSVSGPDMGMFLNKVWKKEEGVPKKDVIKRIVDCADGSPRKAIKLLESIIRLKTEAEMLEAVQQSESREFGINLARCMIFPGKDGGFKNACRMLLNMEDDPETVRQIAMSYAMKVMLGGGKLANRAAKMLSCFQEPIYSAPKQLLALAVYDFYHLA